MWDIKFAVCLSVCLSICSGRINSETAERIWLKFCTGTEGCSRHCLSHFGGNRPPWGVPVAENVPWEDIVLVVH